MLLQCCYISTDGVQCPRTAVQFYVDAETNGYFVLCNYHKINDHGCEIDDANRNALIAMDIVFNHYMVSAGRI